MGRIALQENVADLDQSFEDFLAFRCPQIDGHAELVAGVPAEESESIPTTISGVIAFESIGTIAPAQLSHQRERGMCHDASGVYLTMLPRLHPDHLSSPIGKQHLSKGTSPDGANRSYSYPFQW